MPHIFEVLKCTFTFLVELLTIQLLFSHLQLLLHRWTTADWKVAVSRFLRIDQSPVLPGLCFSKQGLLINFFGSLWSLNSTRDLEVEEYETSDDDGQCRRELARSIVSLLAPGGDTPSVSRLVSDRTSRVYYTTDFSHHNVTITSGARFYPRTLFRVFFLLPILLFKIRSLERTSSLKPTSMLFILKSYFFYRWGPYRWLFTAGEESRWRRSSLKKCVFFFICPLCGRWRHPIHSQLADIRSLW